MNNIVLSAENLGKVYPLPKGELRVFQGIDFELQKGDLAAIMGISGVGKTTLLNLLGTLDRPSEGTIRLDGEDLAVRSDLEISGLRNSKIGFVFQFYHLLPEFTALENISIPLLIRGTGRKEALPRARKLLDEVGLGDKANFRPGQMSGGEQQRVAVARALVNEPKVLLADEPTGNLDWKTGEMVLRLILDLHQKKGLSSVIVTHNEKIAAYCHRLYVMEAGELKLSPSFGR
jgi:ABC-type lipoprotein export system ATPase subunit